MKRVTKVSDATPAPFVDLATVARHSRVVVRGGIEIARPLDTTVTACVSTDTYYVDPDDAAVGLEIEVQRTFGRYEQRVTFDIPANQLDVFLVAVTEAIRLARENGVVDAALAKCAEVAS